MGITIKLMIIIYIKSKINRKYKSKLIKVV